MESGVLNREPESPRGQSQTSGAGVERAFATAVLFFAAWLFIDPSWLYDLRLRTQGHAIEARVVGKEQSWSDGDSPQARERLRGPGLRKTIRARTDDGKTFEVEAGADAWSRLSPGQEVGLLIEPSAGRAILRDAASPGARSFGRALSVALLALAGAWTWRAWRGRGRSRA